MPPSKEPKVKESPEDIELTNPSWSFYKCDEDGRWAFAKNKLGNVFWEKIVPRLKGFETQRWCDFSGPKKDSHFISVNDLNKCAQDRLKHLKITEESIFSLRIEGKLRVYGLRPKSSLVILWYDDGHGDNDTCVCRSKKKHT